jgi:5-methylcytosine-specific restriction endonuclease McrA
VLTKEILRLQNKLELSKRIMEHTMEKIRESFITLSYQLEDEELKRKTVSFLYWNVPEVTVSMIKEFMYPERKQIHKIIDEFETNIECKVCHNLLVAKSRNQLREWMMVDYRRSKNKRIDNDHICDKCKELIGKEQKLERDDLLRKEEDYRKERIRYINMPYSEYLKTDIWNERRKRHLRSAGYRCQVCNTKNAKLNIHHRTYERLGEEYFTDLIVLCESCHSLFHNQGKIK